MNYRYIYEYYTKTKVPRGYDIHHIDLNHKNDKIRNLVALPRKLHNLYHELAKNVSVLTPYLELTGIVDGGNGVNEYYKNEYLHFFDVYKKCQKYIDYRDYLLGLIPDIHGIGENYGNNQNQ